MKKRLQPSSSSSSMDEHKKNVSAKRQHLVSEDEKFKSDTTFNHHLELIKFKELQCVRHFILESQKNNTPLPSEVQTYLDGIDKVEKRMVKKRPKSPPSTPPMVEDVIKSKYFDSFPLTLAEVCDELAAPVTTSAIIPSPMPMPLSTSTVLRIWSLMLLHSGNIIHEKPRFISQDEWDEYTKLPNNGVCIKSVHDDVIAVYFPFVYEKTIHARVNHGPRLTKRIINDHSYLRWWTCYPEKEVFDIKNNTAMTEKPLGVYRYIKMPRFFMMSPYIKYLLSDIKGNNEKIIKELYYFFATIFFELVHPKDIIPLYAKKAGECKRQLTEYRYGTLKMACKYAYERIFRRLANLWTAHSPPAEDGEKDIPPLGTVLPN
jgi:hypothetical protein